MLAFLHRRRRATGVYTRDLEKLLAASRTKPEQRSPVAPFITHLLTVGDLLVDPKLQDLVLDLRKQMPRRPSDPHPRE